MIFDSHAHLVAADMERYPPAPLKGVLDRVLKSFTVEDLIEQMDERGVRRAVAVQRAHVYGFDNAYVADAAARYPDRLVAIGMIDPLDPRSPEQVRYWVRERGLAGIRMTEAVKGSGDAWVRGPIARDVWAAATELGVPVCFHFMRWNRVECLAALETMCALFPQTPVVIDHFSNLVAEEGPPDHGVDAPLLRFAPLKNVFHKFTTINLAKAVAAGIEFSPVLQQMLAIFGADRVMWGSDVAQSEGSYAEMIDAAKKVTRTLDGEARRQVMHDTGYAIYGSNRGRSPG